MTDNRSQGITPKQLEELFFRLVQDFETKFEQTEIYQEDITEMRGLISSTEKIPEARRENALQNVREYLTRRKELRDAYIRVKTIYDLAKEYCPGLFKGTETEQNLESEDFEKGTSLDHMIEDILAEQKRRLDLK